MSRRNYPGRIALVLLVIASPSARFAIPQQQSDPLRPPHSIILPEVNRMPDANERMRMDQQSNKQKNFDAQNAQRAQQMNDDATKLLILARDLNAELEKAGDDPLPNKVLREAEVIELLARDLQNRMTLKIGGS